MTDRTYDSERIKQTALRPRLGETAADGAEG